nr:MAG TPA: hypothetical protein [Caudoviricetes sp.]
MVYRASKKYAGYNKNQPPMKGLIMFNRVTGLSLLVVSAGSIAYQLVKQHRENVEAERRARIEVDQIINQLKEFNACIAEGPSIYETLDKLSEGFNNNGKLSPGLNS